MIKINLSADIRIGVSACLLGQTVRYDGKDKRHTGVTEILCQHFECVPICPEMAIGLGSPRPPVQLVKTASGIRALGRDDDGIDITDRLIEYSNRADYSDLSGFVLASRSPSCGFGSTPLFDTNDHEIGKVYGLFADAILKNNKTVPMIEDKDLDDENLLGAFITKVNAGLD